MTISRRAKGSGIGVWVVIGSIGVFTGCAEAEAEPVASSWEALEFVPGSTVVSNFADPSRTYLSNRIISNLVTLGAMSPLLASVAQRVDGIIDNKPANGRFSLDELER